MRAFFKSSPRGGANVVDGKLILSYPHARTPVVWQMDLSQAGASALEVREAGGENFTLLLKTPRGEPTDIAQFETRPQAVEALMNAARALEKAHGQIRPSGAAGQAFPAPGKKSAAGKWGAAALVILLLFVLLNIWGAMLPRPAGTGPETAGNAAMPDSGNAQPENGVPLSADDVLNTN